MVTCLNIVKWVISSYKFLLSWLLESYIKYFMYIGDLHQKNSELCLGLNNLKVLQLSLIHVWSTHKKYVISNNDVKPCFFHLLTNLWKISPPPPFTYSKCTCTLLYFSKIKLYHFILTINHNVNWPLLFFLVTIYTWYMHKNYSQLKKSHLGTFTLFIWKYSQDRFLTYIYYQIRKY